MSAKNTPNSKATKNSKTPINHWQNKPRKPFMDHAQILGSLVHRKLIAGLTREQREMYEVARYIDRANDAIFHGDESNLVPLTLTHEELLSHVHRADAILTGITSEQWNALHPYIPKDEQDREELKRFRLNEIKGWIERGHINAAEMAEMQDAFTTQQAVETA